MFTVFLQTWSFAPSPLGTAGPWESCLKRWLVVKMARTGKGRRTQESQQGLWNSREHLQESDFPAQGPGWCTLAGRYLNNLLGHSVLFRQLTHCTGENKPCFSVEFWWASCCEQGVVVRSCLMLFLCTKCCLTLACWLPINTRRMSVKLKHAAYWIETFISCEAFHCKLQKTGHKCLTLIRNDPRAESRASP